MTNENRPEIPTELRRLVLLEAGHRCAIPTCQQTEIDIHHIVPWERCKSHEFNNLIALCPICHRRAHKGEIDRKSLLAYKRNLSDRVDHGTCISGPVDIDRALGSFHVLKIAGHLQITASGWTTGLEKITIKILNAGAFGIAWPVKTLPKNTKLTKQGYDIVELTHIDGDVHFHHVLSVPTDTEMTSPSVDKTRDEN